MQRYRISRLPDIEGDKPPKKTFKRDPISYCPVDIAQVQTAEGKLQLFVAIDRTSTVNDLAGEVGASRRTVLRDIVALRDQGFVIHSESGRGGGLQLDPESVQTLLGSP